MEQREALLENIDRNAKPQEKSLLVSWIKFILVIAFIFFVFRYAVGITVISGDSMNPTIENRNILLSSNFFFIPERQDIIIFEMNQGYKVIKRVIGLPGDTVEITNGIVYLNEQPLDEEYTLGTSDDMPKITVAEGNYFVLGDNRVPGESLDSRSQDVATIPLSAIQGELIFSISPFKMVK